MEGWSDECFSWDISVVGGGGGLVVSKVTPLEVMIGDHSVILFEVAGTVEAPDPVFKRNWKTYTQKN